MAAPIALATLLALAATFLLLHAELARSARFVPDDLCVSGSVRMYGALGAQRGLYRTWSGRWASNAMVVSAMKLLPHDPRASVPFAIFLVGFASVTTWAAAHLLAARRVVRGAVLPLLAVTTVALAFFASPHRGDSWFFVFCALENVVPSVAALLGLACVLRSDERPWLAVPGGLLAAVATACHESVALAVLASGVVLLALAALRDRHDPRLRAGAIVLLVAVASFAVSAASPGSSARLGQLPREPLFAAAWQTLRGGPRVVAGIARATASELAVAFFAWAVAACVLAPPLRSATRRAPGRHAGAGAAASRATALAALALLPVIAIAGTFPGFYALGEPPPSRAQFVLAAALLAAAATLGALTGAALRTRPRAGGALAACLVAGVGMLLSREVVRMRADIATARAYAAAYDARTELLLARRGERSREPIVVAALPPSGVLRDAELSSERPGAYANHCLRRLLRLGRPLLRSPDPPAVAAPS